MSDKCIIVINNFDGADIIPVIFRQLDVALGRAEYTHPKFGKSIDMETLWVPKEWISKLNGDFSLNYTFNNYYVCS